MSVNAVSKHLFVLERRRPDPPHRGGGTSSPACSTQRRWRAPTSGSGVYRRFWNGKIDRLAEFVEKPKG